MFRSLRSKLASLMLALGLILGLVTPTFATSAKKPYAFATRCLTHGQTSGTGNKVSAAGACRKETSVSLEEVITAVSATVQETGVTFNITLHPVHIFSAGAVCTDGDGARR